MASNGSQVQDSLVRLVSRVDQDALTEIVLDSFWDRPEYEPFRPDRDQLRAWVRWNVELVGRWIVDGVVPGEQELSVFRDRARGRAEQHMPADIVPGNFRRGARAAWAYLVEVARDDERAALLEGADRLFDFVDRVSQVFSAAYEQADVPQAGVDDRRAREVLDRLVADQGLTPDLREFAVRIGFPLAASYRPFLAGAQNASRARLESFSAGLLGRGCVAAVDGNWVVGLADCACSAESLRIDGWQYFSLGRRTRLGGLRDVMANLRDAADIARLEGSVGAIDVDDHLADLLLLRSPSLRDRLVARVYGQLADHDPELTRTLDCLIEHDFDHSAVAAALPAHRNTLGNRLRRIEAATGLDVARTEDRALIWIAWRARHRVEQLPLT